MTRRLIGFTLAASLVLAAPVGGQGLYNLGFTLDGRPGPGWIETPLGVISDMDYMVWWLTLRGFRAEAPVRMATSTVLTP